MSDKTGVWRMAYRCHSTPLRRGFTAISERGLEYCHVGRAGPNINSARVGASAVGGVVGRGTAWSALWILATALQIFFVIASPAWVELVAPLWLILLP
jgi:hypothetical protein